MIGEAGVHCTSNNTTRGHGALTVRGLVSSTSSEEDSHVNGGGKDGGVNAAVPDDLEKKQGVDSGIACKEKATLESSSCRLVLIVEMKLANSLVRAAPKTLEDRAHFISRT